MGGRVKLFGYFLGQRQPGFRQGHRPPLCEIGDSKGENIFIGRHSICAVPVLGFHGAVSRRHVEIGFTDDGILITNLGRNGTTVHEVESHHGTFGPSSSEVRLGPSQAFPDNGSALLCLAEKVWVYLDWYEEEYWLRWQDDAHWVAPRTKR